MSKQTTIPALSTAELDRLGHAVVELAMELWVLHDRQRVLESRLEELGLDIQVEAAAPPPDLAASLDAERDAFVKKLIDTLTGRDTALRSTSPDD